MLTDIEIAAQAKMKRITDVAAAMGIRPEELEPYGHYKAKLSDDLLIRLQDRPDGKLVLEDPEYCASVAFTVGSWIEMLDKYTAS